MNLKLVSVLSIVGLLAACGDSGSSSNGGSGGTGTGGGDGGTTTNTGGNGPGPAGPGPAGPGTGGNGGGEPACYDDSQATALLPLTVLVGQNACTVAQVDDYYTACLDNATASEAACQAFADDAANAACDACFSGNPTNNMAVNHPPLLPAGMYVFVNTIACEAAVQMKEACAQSAADLQFCVFNTCGECEQMTELPDCLGYSEQDICGQNFTVTEDCATLFPAEGMGAPECEGSDFESLFKSVANFICGAP